MTPRRVVHVTQPVDAGVAAVVRSLLLDQQEQGWSVHLLCPQGPLSRWASTAGVPWSRWNAGREPGPATVRETATLRRLIAGLAPDLVHLHSSKAGLAGRLALRGRVPTVFQPHAWSFAAASGAKARAALAWERRAMRWTHLLLCCSVEEQQDGVRRGVNGAAQVVPNGVDLQRFPQVPASERRAARARLGLGADHPVALCVGRLSSQKGQDVAVDAWRRVRGQLPEAVLLLAGDGPERLTLERQAGPGVQVLGHRDDVPDLLAAADVVLLPSRWEGLALALLEAMASGRSVVTTAVAGSESTLLAGDLPAAGAVVPVEDRDALAAAVAARLSDPELAAGEGDAGRLRAARDHDLRRTCGQVRAAYEQVLGRTARGGAGAR